MRAFSIALMLFSFLIGPISAQSAELKADAVLLQKGDGPDGKGNTADDTWQFWFELAHKRNSFRRLTLTTTTLTAQQRKKGIPRKVTGPIAAWLPNPEMTEGWLVHRDWDGRFEGVWADKKTRHVYLHPYVEKGSHCAVAVSYLVPKTGTYQVQGQLTDATVAPNYPKHDGVLWRVERVDAQGKAHLLARGGPIGDGKGRPDSAKFDKTKVELRKGEHVRLVIHPNKWWGADLTRVDSFRIIRLPRS